MRVKGVTIQWFVLWFVAVSACRRSGVSPIWLSTFRLVAVLTHPLYICITLSTAHVSLTCKLPIICKPLMKYICISDINQITLTFPFTLVQLLELNILSIISIRKRRLVIQCIVWQNWSYRLYGSCYAHVKNTMLTIFTVWLKRLSFECNRVKIIWICILHNSRQNIRCFLKEFNWWRPCTFLSISDTCRSTKLTLLMGYASFVQISR